MGNLALSADLPFKVAGFTLYNYLKYELENLEFFIESGKLMVQVFWVFFFRFRASQFEDEGQIGSVYIMEGARTAYVPRLSPATASSSDQ